MRATMRPVGSIDPGQQSRVRKGRGRSSPPAPPARPPPPLRPGTQEYGGPAVAVQIAEALQQDRCQAGPISFTSPLPGQQRRRRRQWTSIAPWRRPCQRPAGQRRVGGGTGGSVSAVRGCLRPAAAHHGVAYRPAGIARRDAVPAAADGRLVRGGRRPVVVVVVVGGGGGGERDPVAADHHGHPGRGRYLLDADAHAADRHVPGDGHRRLRLHLSGRAAEDGPDRR